MSVTAASEKTASRGEWAANWPVPVVSAVGMAVSMLPLYSLGALIPSIQHATHWTRGQISFGPTILSIVAVLLAPMVGGAIDRFGARRVALPGLAIFCLAVGCVSLSGGNVSNWWLAWAFMALADVAIKTTVWTSAVVGLFERTRGLAIGVALSGTGIATTCLPYLATVLQESLGWRGTYAIMAAGARRFPCRWSGSGSTTPAIGGSERPVRAKGRWLPACRLARPCGPDASFNWPWSVFCPRPAASASSSTLFPS